MIINEVFKKEKDKFSDYEVYKFIDKNHKIHTDTIKDVEATPDTEVYCYRLMDQEEYNRTILANTCLIADFGEWFGDKDSKILCIFIGR